MMCEIPLTPEQKIFAAQNHDLVYKFLQKKNLPIDEFYDVVIFGYLNSIHRFFVNPELAKHSFSNKAWKGMQNSLYNYNRAKLRQKRSAEGCSIHAMLYPDDQSDDLHLEETLPVYDDMMQQLEVTLLMHDLAKRISKQQMEIVRLRSSGYNLQDIAARQNTSSKRIRNLLEDVRCVLAELCRE